MKLSEKRKLRKEFKSDCHGASFLSKSNGLWTYFVCSVCGYKTTPKNNKGQTLDLYGRIVKYKK